MSRHTRRGPRSGRSRRLWAPPSGPRGQKFRGVGVALVAAIAQVEVHAGAGGRASARVQRYGSVIAALARAAQGEQERGQPDPGYSSTHFAHGAVVELSSKGIASNR